MQVRRDSTSQTGAEVTNRTEFIIRAIHYQAFNTSCVIRTDAEKEKVLRVGVHASIISPRQRSRRTERETEEQNTALIT